MKGKNTNNKLTCREGLQRGIHSELTAMKNKPNKSFIKNRSEPKNYTKTALFLFYLLTAHCHWPGNHLTKCITHFVMHLVKWFPGK